MLLFLRFLFWPLVLGSIAVGSAILNLPIWSMFWTWFTTDLTGETFVERVLVIVSVFLGIKMTIASLRFTYATYKGRHLVSLKVVLPRSDSKIDQEKRTEKDFKEKLALMEQLFRAIYEVKDLTFWQVVHFWITRYITISFELYVEEGLINFYVLCPPELVSIVEKQITSFYPNAEVVIKKTPELWQKGYKLSGYNMITKKPSHYPLRFFDHMQDDPLNDITNALSKLQSDERACVQVIITPVFSEHWSKKAKAYATKSFKGKSDTVFDKIPGLKIFGNLLGMVTSTDPKSFAPGSSGGDSFVRMIQPEEELYKRMGEKAGMSGDRKSTRLNSSHVSESRMPSSA